MHPPTRSAVCPSSRSREITRSPAISAGASAGNGSTIRSVAAISGSAASAPTFFRMKFMLDYEVRLQIGA